MVGRRLITRRQETTHMVKGIAAFAAALVIAAPAAAQGVDEIIAKHIAAMGGLEKLKAVKSVRMSGTMMVGPGIEAPVVVEMKRPNSMRMDITVQGMVGTQAFDGTKGWTLMPFGGSKIPQEMAAEEMRMAEEQADMDGPLIDYKTKGNKVELLGKETVEGSPAYKLQVTMKGGAVRTMYIDAEHFLTIKEEARRTVRGAEVETETIAGDYKEVEGLMFPHSIDGGQKGSPQRQKMTIQKIELNVPIDDARFKMPDVK
jgi:outer membrane lipoprotein-sorting protein